MPNSETFRVTTPTDREIVVTRVFNSPRNLVFDAWTNPKYLPHWLLGPDGWTMPVCEIDARPGGSWHFVWRHSNGQEMEMRGVYREVQRPERIVSSESWGPDWLKPLTPWSSPSSPARPPPRSPCSTPLRKLATPPSRRA
jgi:uncharacterized protein YndB with AHSA1/START domain